MDRQHWQRVAAIFDEVAEVSPSERAGLLARRCGNDARLRSDLEALLAADDRAGGFERGVESTRRLSAAAWDDDESTAHDERIGPWRVLRELGRGGMGVVLLAERADGAFEQHAALKLIKRGMDTDAVQARFLRERQILARLKHPHIAHLLDGGITADGRPYFAMEFVDGKPLLEHCSDSSLSLEKRLELFLGICDAVQFAHGRLVVHRDIKPSNILIDADGTAKLLDFGIARLLDESASSTIDALHRPLTPAYAAPEQLRGEPATTAADIYALGGVLYELLTGKRALVLADTATPEQARRALETTDPEAPSRVATEAGVPARRLRGDIDTIVLKALQHEPQRRYVTVGELAEDLRRFLGGRPVAARRDHAGYRMGKFVSRHRLGVAATALGLFALVAALAFALWQARAKVVEAEVSQQVTQFLVGLFKGADPTLSRGAVLSAQDLVDQGAERLRADAHMASALRARLLDTVAATYTSLGLYDRALPLAQQALELRRSEPTSAVEIAESLDQLGRVYRLQADYGKAEPLLREALQKRQAALAPDDPLISASFDELGMLLHNRGEFAAADAQFRAARETTERHFGAGAIETARYLDDYAANLDDLGKRREAAALYQQALTIRKQHLGADDPEVATSLVNLGTHLDDSGDYAASVPLLERAVAIRKKIFGAEHPLVGVAELALAGVYESQGRLDVCERMTQEALAIFRRGLPEDHPKISEGLNLLGIVRQERRDFSGAIPLMQEVLARFRKTVGDDHPDTLTAQNNLASALQHAGQLAEAERLQRDVLQRIGADNGEGSAVMDRENLSTTLEMEGKFSEAVMLSKQAVEIQRQHEGDGTANVAIALRHLAVAEDLDGDPDSAEKDFRAALAMGEQVAVSHAIGVFQWRIPLADFLVGHARCAEALPLLDAAQNDLAKDHPASVWLSQAQLLRGECLIASGARQEEGMALLTSARSALRQLPGIEVDLYPTALKLLAPSPR